MGSLTESLAKFKTNHETTIIVIIIINMRLFWTLWILVILLFCERVGSEKRITILTEEQNNQELVISKNSCRFAQLKCSYRTHPLPRRSDSTECATITPMLFVGAFATT